MVDRDTPERLVNHTLGGNQDRTRHSREETHILVRLDAADYLSIVALLFAWASAVLFLVGEPNWAIIVVLVAFFFDKLDGFVARQYDLATALGRELDAFIDVFVYLFSAAMLFHVALSPHPFVSVVVGFFIVCFGVLRLIRFTNEGFRSEGEMSYYRGITVVHANGIVLVNYLLASFIGGWNGWAAALVIVLACPLMVSEYRSYKTVKSQTVAAIAGVLVVVLCLVLEFGIGGTRIIFGG
jgi:phosphatidylserine synthase